MKKLREKLAAQLDRDEGYERSVYRDSLGYYTIGRGHLVDKRKNAGLDDEVIELQFKLDVHEKMNELLERIPWAATLDEARLGALINMAFQLGVSGLLKFRRSLILIRAEQWQAAHDELLKSYTAIAGDEWHEQTPLRAKRIAKQILTGEWQ